ncbi:hypothetical protein PCANC_22491 [Puccinia coronata f. sp. avenae]|uniref:Uncharacterized protein n=1 Tax=Puccinia coronata f. sp. avenae TaxID=200324 RepID=A0A2N5U1X5_9BASI|nr:hypothetical protein PCANC_22491 [Puccinia coronata f. sp. avenae]
MQPRVGIKSTQHSLESKSKTHSNRLLLSRRVGRYLKVQSQAYKHKRPQPRTKNGSMGAVRSICAADPPGTIRNSSINELPDPSATPSAQPPLRGYDEQGNQPVNGPLSREMVVTMERTPFKYKEPLASQDPSVYWCQHRNTSQRRNHSSSNRRATAAPTCKPTGITLPITAA